MVSAKELAKMELELEKPLDLKGHSACAGCGLTTTHRMTMLALGENTIQVTPACCTSIVESPYPKSSFNIPFLNIAFAAAASAGSGMVAAMERQGRDDVNVLAWAGDGGTVDIGFATISGAAERNDNMIYICYDNEAYGNTGNQRSGATPPGAKTSTTPTGNTEKGKFMPFLMMAHEIPYVATTSSGYPRDIYEKVKRASQIKGFKYIHVLSACPTNWRSPVERSAELAQLGVKTGFWPMFEVVNGTEVSLTKRFARYKNPEKREPLEIFVKPQGRFKGLYDRPEQLKLLKNTIEGRWHYLDKFL